MVGRDIHRGGCASPQAGSANGQRSAKRQPGGGSTRLGGEPSIGTRSSPARSRSGEAFISPIV